MRFRKLNDIGVEEYFIQNVISIVPLNKINRDRLQRFFPDKNSSSDNALYLGIKLVKNGSVAIFIGRKDSAKKLVTNVVEIYERGYKEEKPVTQCKSDQVSKFKNYIERLIGINCTVYQSVTFGILLHHRNIPQGLRLSSEYAIQNLDFKFLICTSTLAQGVNLPIKYLIISTTQQGKDAIQYRDFQNLIGRAGRAGKFTEGDIIFSNPKIFKGQTVSSSRWHWEQALNLTNPKNSKPCESRLLDYFKEPTIPAYLKEKERINEIREWEEHKKEIRKDTYPIYISVHLRLRELKMKLTDWLKILSHICSQMKKKK